MRTTLILGGCALLLTATGSSQTASKPKFHGNWTLDSQKSDLKVLKLASSSLVIDQEKVAELSFRQKHKLSDNSERTVEFKCNTTGKECSYTVGSEPATISLFYNGPMLVGYERLGSSGQTVNRYNISMSEDGSTLTLELSQLEPQRPEKDKLVYVKQ
ncbi:MAG TPA: hypothetical protein VFL57_22155 [Bryobacteraceae bacterium]|nr:hypothetical protein [Bryobacteraceae bacterium]